MEKPVFGGGYTCSVCGKYQRTSTICRHDNLIIDNMKQIPTAEEMFNANPILPEGITRQACMAFMTTFAKLHVQAALESAAEIINRIDGTNNFEESILNAYLLDNIK